MAKWQFSDCEYIDHDGYTVIRCVHSSKLVPSPVPGSSQSHMLQALGRHVLICFPTPLQTGHYIHVPMLLRTQ